MNLWLNQDLEKMRNFEIMMDILGENMIEEKEHRVDVLYDELVNYSGDLYELSKLLVKILPRQVIWRIIGKLYRIRKNEEANGN